MQARGYTRWHPKKRGRLAVTILGCLLALVLLAGHFVLAYGLPSARALSADSADSSGSLPVLATGLQPLTNAGAFDLPVQVAKTTDTGFLQLVNASHPLSSQSVPPRLVTAWPTVLASDHSTLLQSTALQAFSGLFQAAADAQVGGLSVNSGYRDYAAQELVYEQTTNKSYVQLPGQSEHQTGLAADIEICDAGQSSGISAAAEQWLVGHSWRYGLILRYPAGKQGITQIAYEPWHFRYIGEPHAWYCWEHGLCLEEYLDYLQDSGGYQVTLGATTYYVYYEAAQNGILYMPRSLDYEVSSDGCGGYIVTAWE
ncbi:MAG: M15 family metallopeptidase [Coriobacteriia bacterium]|nr:M15 family metallopeptidase [Coriobacteriia bacterium]